MQVDAEILLLHLQIIHTLHKGLTQQGAGPWLALLVCLRLGAMHSPVVTHFLFGPGIWKTEMCQSQLHEKAGLAHQSLKGTVFPG